MSGELQRSRSGVAMAMREGLHSAKIRAARAEQSTADLRASSDESSLEQALRKRH
jgi:hypothetical protein